MDIILKRKDISLESRDKGNINLTVFDFNIPSQMIYRADEIIYKNGSFEKVFKTRHEWVK